MEEITSWWGSKFAYFWFSISLVSVDGGRASVHDDIRGPEAVRGQGEHEVNQYNNEFV